MLYKLFIFLIGSIIESTTKEYLKGICGKNFNKRTEYLHEQGIITDHLKTEIDWVWDIRNKMHLFKLDDREWDNNYDINNHLKCIATFRGLLDALSQKGKL